MVCARLPAKISQQQYSIRVSARPRQIFLPVGPRRPTSMSVPRWPPSLIATIAPRKVIQTKAQRDNSSDTVMPELKT